MAGWIPDVEDLSGEDLKKLVLQLLEKVASLEAENAALREEIARLKGLEGRPKTIRYRCQRWRTPTGETIVPRCRPECAATPVPICAALCLPSIIRGG